MENANPRKALSLFSGAGGMDIGVRDAGFHVFAQIEADKHCCDTLRAAKERENADTRIYEADIRSIQPATLRKELALEKGELDLLFGGPPCQSFSLAGKQLGIKDERGMLLFEIVRFAAEFEPKVILVEQVKGLLSSKGTKKKKGEIFDKFLASLEDAGYTPKWRIMLVADYGIPQMRERLFVVGTRGKNGFVFPDQTHAPPKRCSGLFPLKPHVGIGEVIGGLGPPDPKIKGTTFYAREDGHVDVTPPRDRERIAGVPEGSYLAAQLHLGEDLRRGLKSRDTTKYLRLHRKKPANTLRCGEIFYHPTEDRYLTPREYMRIHGFPDDYLLVGPIRSRTGTVKNLDQHRQVANSVPPPMARILALRIAELLDRWADDFIELCAPPLILGCG
jgi:DNA (cytosine-5)-methyltransferase 1